MVEKIRIILATEDAGLRYRSPKASPVFVDVQGVLCQSRGFSTDSDEEENVLP